MTRLESQRAGDWLLSPFGDGGVVAEWIGEPEHAAASLSAVTRLAPVWLYGVTDVVPAIQDVLIVYDVWRTDWHSVARQFARLLAALGESDRRHEVIVEIRVCYGGTFGPDLPEVAAACGLSEAEVVALHTAKPMPVLMIGFMPGFPYIGGLPARLHLPRRPEPRAAVPSGSVAIAVDQTGIYPSRSPGGWHLIGHTDQTLFDPWREPPALLSAGMLVQFVAR